MLGKSFYYGDSVCDKSLYRAKHYFEVAAEAGIQPAYHFLACTLCQLNEAQYKNVFGLPGHNYVPRAMYWMRKVTEAGAINDAKTVMGQLEELGKRFCANCHKSAADIPGPLKHCAKCKAIWYCSKECQVKSWNEGHRMDCNFNTNTKTNVMGSRQL